MIWCASVKVVGHHGNRYGPEWVNRLHRAMDRNLRAVDVKHVCLTDDPAGLASWIHVEDIGPWWRRHKDFKGGLYNPIGGWWAKTKLFDPRLSFNRVGGKVLYCDLDTLIVGPLDDMLCEGGELRICADTAKNKTAKPGVVRRFNSSVMSWRAGTYSHFYDTFGPAALRRWRSDQDLIAETAPLAVTYPPERIQRLSACLDSGPAPDTRVVLCIKPKNDEAAERAAWVKKVWQ